MNISIEPEAECHDTENEQWEEERLSTGRVFEMRRRCPFEHILFTPHSAVERGADSMCRIERRVGQCDALEKRLPQEADASGYGAIQSVTEMLPPSREKLIYPTRPINAHIEYEEVEQEESPDKQKQMLIAYNPRKNRDEENRRTEQALQKIIRDFESVNARQRIGTNVSVFVSYARSEPIDYLPVSASPSVIAREHGAERFRKFIEHIDISGIGGSCECAFEEVMAENLIGRKCSVERGEKRIDMKRALSCKTPFEKKILVYFREYGGIGAEALFVEKNARETKPMAIFEPLLYMRLNEGVPVCERARLIKRGMLKRMRVDAEHILDTIPRDERVFVECDDKIGLGDRVSREEKWR